MLGQGEKRHAMRDEQAHSRRVASGRSGCLAPPSRSFPGRPRRAALELAKAGAIVLLALLVQGGPVEGTGRSDFVARALLDAQALARRHLPDRAALRLQAARQLVGDDPELLLALARMDEDLENYAEAERLCRDALSRRPEDLDAAFNLAEVLVCEGKAELASEMVRKLSRHDGLPARLVGRLRFLELEIKGLGIQKRGLLALLAYGASVLPTLRGAVRLAPDSADIRYALGRFYLLAPVLMGGDLRQARSELGKACQLDPASFEFRAWAIAADSRAGLDTSFEQREYRADFGHLVGAGKALARALAFKLGA